MKKLLAVVIVLMFSSGSVCQHHGWTKLLSSLAKRDMSLAMRAMGGASYFSYDTKAIDNHFPTGEASVELLFAKRLNDYFRLEAGLRLGMKFRKQPGYDYDAAEVELKDWQFSLVEVDQVLSTSNHFTYGVPVTVQYTPGKLALGIGGCYRYFLAAGTSTAYPGDFLAGRHEGGLLGNINYPLGSSIKVGAEYYYGLVNVHQHYMYIPSGAPPKVVYNTYNRVAQLFVSYTFGAK